jgi:hypothetical protein
MGSIKVKGDASRDRHQGKRGGQRRPCNRFQVLLVAIALTSNSGATAWQQPAVVGSCRAITPINAVGRSERPLSDNSWAERPPRACEKAPECTTHYIYKFRSTGICKSPTFQEERKQLYHWHSFYPSKTW